MGIYKSNKLEVTAGKSHIQLCDDFSISIIASAYKFLCFPWASQTQGGFKTKTGRVYVGAGSTNAKKDISVNAAISLFSKFIQKLEGQTKEPPP